MPTSPKTASCWWFCAFALIFSLQVVPRIFMESPTNDEPRDITNGYFCWKGDFDTDPVHPPFLKMLQSLPTLLMHPKDSIDPGMKNDQLRAYDFFFILNKNNFETLMWWGRFITLFFGIGIGWLLFITTRNYHSSIWISTLVLWAFEPTILAFSGICGSDVPSTFFFFAAILTFQKHLETRRLHWAVAAGSLAAMAAFSKFSALLLLPVFIVLETISVLRSKKKNRYFSGNFQGSKNWIAGLASFFSLIFIFYLPGTLFERNHENPFAYFYANLNALLSYVSVPGQNFFLGHGSRQSHWLFFPVAFAVKTTVPFFILAVGAITLSILKKIKLSPWIWIPPLAFFLFILNVQNMGVRYLLPIFPFLILMEALVIGQLWKWKPSGGKNLGRILVIGLLLWHAVSALANFPNMIGYFNDFIPEERKVYYLGDSNLDFGQDVKKLAREAEKKGWKKVKLAQFGGAIDPSIYGLNWLPWTQKDLAGPQPGFVYAVNMALFQLGPLFWPDLVPIAQGWAINLPPTGRIGNSWIYFEVPGEPRPDDSPALNSVRIF